ncbi:unnamed protein product [Prunus armeniaca]|uniref:Uncharacterized protein n=1 Tax=Prunus armeniaca TaxID=36596 RepID=A0A6J5XAE3_PRUAR|nr:unnamed protein product [Prunus armeniaca]
MMPKLHHHPPEPTKGFSWWHPDPKLIKCMGDYRAAALLPFNNPFFQLLLKEHCSNKGGSSPAPLKGGASPAPTKSIRCLVGS